LQETTANRAPKIGAKIYIHKCCKLPETTAGAMDRAGFIEAFVMGPANMASNNTTPPIAIPATTPISLLPVETFIITTIKKKVNKNSKIKARQTSTVGIVAPRVSLAGNRT
jgi:hypothetical protein